MTQNTKPLSLVTGASSGIGRAFAERLAKDGHDLIVVARRKDRLEELASALRTQYGSAVEVLIADLATPGGIDAVRKRIAQGPALETLVCSAGFGTRGLYHEVSPEKTLSMVSIHVASTVACSAEAIGPMRAAGRGRMIFVSSLSGYFTAPRYVAYSATKAFIHMLAQGLDAELQGTGVRVTVTCPGLTKTEFLDTEEYREFKYGQAPSWSWMSADDVVAATLASRDLFVIPGLPNKLLVAALHTPVLGALLMQTLKHLSREKNGLY